jgi:hypothetical protein
MSRAGIKETEWQRRTRRARERAEHVEQHGAACQICGNVPKRGLDQDHDHKTGLTRGWLCHRCNRALPTWVDVEWLLRAARYLGPVGITYELGFDGVTFRCEK